MNENKFLLHFCSLSRCFLVVIYFALKFSTTFLREVEMVERESKLNFQFSVHVWTFHNLQYYIIYFIYRERKSFALQLQGFSIDGAKKRVFKHQMIPHSDFAISPSQFSPFFTLLKASIYIQRDKLNNSNLFSEV